MVTRELLFQKGTGELQCKAAKGGQSGGLLVLTIKSIIEISILAEVTFSYGQGVSEKTMDLKLPDKLLQREHPVVSCSSLSAGSQPNFGAAVLTQGT